MKVDTHKVNMGTYDRISGIYALKNFDAMNMIPRMDQFLEQIKAGGNILDLGCGPGHDSQYMISKGYKVLGVDFSEEMIKIARKRVPEGEFICTDIRDLEIKEDQYDGIWCNSVLLHFEDVDKIIALKKIYKTLNKGGVLHVSFSEGDGKRLLDREVEGISDRKVYYDNDQTELESMLKDIGFEIISQKKEKYGITFILFFCRKN